jgi:hypothetical protein
MAEKDIPFSTGGLRTRRQYPVHAAEVVTQGSFPEWLKLDLLHRRTNRCVDHLMIGYTYRIEPGRHKLAILNPLRPADLLQSFQFLERRRVIVDSYVKRQPFVVVKSQEQSTAPHGCRRQLLLRPAWRRSGVARAANVHSPERLPTFVPTPAARSACCPRPRSSRPISDPPKMSSEGIQAPSSPITITADPPNRKTDFSEPRLKGRSSGCIWTIRKRRLSTMRLWPRVNLRSKEENRAS